jgi:hypothetical protein
MTDRSTTPSIEVTIGRQTRLYHAFITTAPAVLDSPPRSRSTPDRSRTSRAWRRTPRARRRKAGTPSRLVLIDTTELGWQRARCRANSRRLSPADPVLVATLQQWLWQRLQMKQLCTPEGGAAAD